MRNTFGLRVSAATIGAVSALVLLPGAAGAAFDAGHAAPCQGTESIVGAGASFQNSAHLAWGATVQTTAASAVGFGYAPVTAGGCSDFKLPGAGGSKTVNYLAGGSGTGRLTVGASVTPELAGVRNTAVQFAAADEPPSAAELAASNAGADKIVGSDDDAILHTIPIAQSSVAIAVRLPDGCTLPVGSRRITQTRLEGAFNASASANTWGKILPAIVGAGCADKPFKRIVRNSESGTTFALKSFLATISAANWPSAMKNVDWPAETPDNINKLDGTSAGALLDTLTAQTVNGGIGYADLATARSRGYDPSGNVETANRFWLEVERSNGIYLSPALQGAQASGANCRNVTYKDTVTNRLPATTDHWNMVSGAGTETDYPLCSLTYALVWEDMAKANVNRPAGKPAYTQGQARAVKDYLGYILNQAGGQSRLEPAGFQALPVDPVSGGATAGTVLAIAQAGLAKLTWNGQPVVVTPEDPKVDDPTTPDVPVPNVPVPNVPLPNVPNVPSTPGKPTPPAVKASAKVTKAAAAKGRTITLTVNPSVAGKASVVATLKVGKKTVKVAAGNGTAKKAGAFRVKLSPTAAGKSALKAGRTAKLTFTVTFTATDGSKLTTKRTSSVKIKR